MSIIRLSALKQAIHGVRSDGAFVHGPYQRSSRTGQTERYREPDSPAGGLPTVHPGSGPLDWRELDRRGFPRDTSDLYHLMDSLVRPAVQSLGDGPVVIMVHGFLFDPRDSVSPDPADSDNPHARLYHFKESDLQDEIRDHTTSWPLGLGFQADDNDGGDGLAVAFGWHSRPGIAASLISTGKNFYARAYDNAEPAAWNLLTVLHLLDLFLPAGKKIDILCHSLGSRVVVRMIALAAKHGRLDLLARLDRVVTLGGSEYVVEARLMLRRLHGVEMGEALSFYNVVSRENDVLDKLAENFGPITFGNSNVIGHNGLDVENPDSLGPTWLDLQIDGVKLQRWMKDKRGLTVTGDNPAAVWDHWYYYTDPGNMALYRAILRDRAQWVIPELRQGGEADRIPDKVARRRSIFGD